MLGNYYLRNKKTCMCAFIASGKFLNVILVLLDPEIDIWPSINTKLLSINHLIGLYFVGVYANYGLCEESQIMSNIESMGL